MFSYGAKRALNSAVVFGRGCVGAGAGSVVDEGAGEGEERALRTWWEIVNGRVGGAGRVDVGI